MKIKTRKQREKDYIDKYGDISDDKFTRLQEFIGDKFNEKLFQMVNHRIKEIKKNIKYKSIKFTFYELPVESHRPRVSGTFGGLYVPNAKQNWNAMNDFIKDLKIDLKKISTPIKISLKAFYKMPSNINPVDIVIYETEHDYGLGKPDFDNVLKAYSDMIIGNLILDDDLVVSAEFNKYFSLKPRVEMIITYANGCATDYVYKAITSRKSFKDIEKHTSIKLLVTPYAQLRRIFK